MNRQNRIKTVLTLAVVAMAVMSTSATAEITFDGFQSWQPTSALGTFDASGSDKLVVVATGEHNFGGNLSGNIVNITYDGVGLTKAVEVNPADPATGGHGQTATDIWYLDNPGSYYTAGLIQASVSGNGNNYVYTAIGLSGTAEGVGPTAAAPGAATVDLTTTAAGSIVIFNIGMGGQGNTASPLPGVTATSPAEAVTIAGLEAGNNWAGHAVAYAIIGSPGLNTFSFGTTKTDVATIAAAFEDAYIDPNAPSVDAGANMISWSGALVALDPNVVVPPGSDWTSLTYLWTASPDGIGDPNLDVVITGADTENASVTITKAVPTGDATVVTMTLAVNNAGNPPEDAVTDTMTIDVYDDACVAAKAVGLVEIDPTDFDENCITNFADFAVLAITWLDDYALTGPVAK